MPELIEVEAYRRAAEAAVGRRIDAVDVPDTWFARRAGGREALVALLGGARVTATGRRGKLLLLDTDGPTLGLRFGMTGRLLVDGAGPIDALEYGPSRHDPAWNRFGLRFEDGGGLLLVDPRRLGGVELDPDLALLALLGPDAASIPTAALRLALHGSAPLKARLLDQRRIAGLGNLLTDETLYRAGFDPRRPCGGLDDAEVRRLARTIRSTVSDLTRRGGSHTGDLQPERRAAGHCPRDGAPLRREPVGGRTTVWCPAHQA